MEKKGNSIDSAINEQKEELKEWKKELENNLSKNTYRKENLFIVSKYWFDRYDNFVLNSNNDLEESIEKNDEIKDNNNELFSAFTESTINVEELPKIFVINKNIWLNIRSKFNDLNTITTEGIFSNELLTLKILNSIYCFVFFDKKKKLRQGYIQILDIDDEGKIMENLREKGIFKFLKEKLTSIGDDIINRKTTKYHIYIFKTFIEDNENANLSELEKAIIQRKKTMDFKKLFEKKEKKDEINYFFGTKSFDVKKTKTINENEKMGEWAKKLKNLFSFRTEQKVLRSKDNKKKDKDNQNSFFPEKSIKREYKPGVIGLKNVGATCYMNATIQCFSNIKRFRMNLLKICLDLGQDKNDKKLSFALAVVFYNLWENLENKEYAPNNFKETIGEMNPLFRGIAANDPKDLVIFLMQTIHKELNYPPQKQLINNYMINTSNFNDVFNEFIQHFTNNNNSIVCEEFYGCSNSMTTCAKCSTTIHNTQAINILIFPLEEVKKYVNKEKSVTIEDCFLHYEKQDIYPSFYCNYCRQLYPAYNQNKLIYTPPTLIINLNRGRGIQYDVGIEFGENLNIRKYVYAEESPNYYELVGVISHFGSNDMGGHFIAFCKNVDNCNWYKYNDGIVTLADFNDIKKGGLPYVLFYSFIQT